MKRLFALAALIAVLFSFSRAEAQEDQYLRIYGLIQEGDNLRPQQPAAAYSKYLEAQTLLQHFQRVYPEWNIKVVKYRLGYLASTLAEISAKNPSVAEKAKANGAADGASSVPPTHTPTPAIAIAPAQPSTVPDEEVTRQLNALQGQIRQLQSDKGLLEAKLQEALRLQPATVDPRALARAEQEIKSLQKENALLNVNLAQRPEKTAPVVDTKTFDQVRQQLALSNRKLVEQADRASKLESEKTALQSKLDNLIPSAWNAASIEETRKSLDEANRKIAEQTEAASKSALERTALQMRVKTLMKESEAAAALRAENEILKKQVAELKAAPQENSQSAARELAEAKAQIAALQSDRAVLRLEKAALEQRVKQLPSVAPAVSAPAPAVAAADAARVKQLESERDDLRKKLNAAQKELSGLKAKNTEARIGELNSQVEALRAKLAVVETQKVPYTEEELELLKNTEMQIVDSKAGKKPAGQLPPGSMALVTEAKKDFAARRLDQAEAKYLQVLKQDNKNVETLANLAAIQLEMNHLEDAEKNLKQALAASPDDAYSLSLLGLLKFRQNKFDEALDALGRAAKLDPQNAEIQNYLGLTLCQKGMRDTGESALRKAVTLDPNYASAHYNLAVIYITQKPPKLELARLHYKRALACGLSANPDMDKLLNGAKAPEADKQP